MQPRQRRRTLVVAVFLAVQALVVTSAQAERRWRVVVAQIQREGEVAPSASAPWRDLGLLLSGCPADRDGNPRTVPVDLGPFETP